MTRRVLTPVELRARGKEIRETNERLGAQIKAARETLGWSQTELAARANLYQPSLSAMERGARPPGRLTLRKLATALGVTVDWLIN